MYTLVLIEGEQSFMLPGVSPRALVEISVASLEGEHSFHLTVPRIRTGSIAEQT